MQTRHSSPLAYPKAAGCTAAAPYFIGCLTPGWYREAACRQAFHVGTVMFVIRMKYSVCILFLRRLLAFQSGRKSRLPGTSPL